MAKKNIHPEVQDISIAFPKLSAGIANQIPDTIVMKSTMTTGTFNAETRIENHIAWRADKTKTFINADNSKQKSFIDAASALFGEE